MKLTRWGHCIGCVGWWMENRSPSSFFATNRMQSLGPQAGGSEQRKQSGIWKLRFGTFLSLCLRCQLHNYGRAIQIVARPSLSGFHRFSGWYPFFAFSKLDCSTKCLGELWFSVFNRIPLLACDGIRTPTSVTSFLGSSMCWVANRSLVSDAWSAGGGLTVHCTSCDMATPPYMPLL